jgi:antitoxin YefM
MRAIKAADLQNNFNGIFNMVTRGETVIVSRPSSENMVILPEKDYNEIIKAKQNAEYMEKIDRAFQQIEEGQVVVKTMEELEEMAK